MYIHLFQSLSFAICFASVLSHLGDEPVWTGDYSEESRDGASQHPEQASSMAYPWAPTEILNISMNGRRLWNGSGATPVSSEDTRDLEVNEAPLLPLVPEWSNRSVHVPRLPLHRAASPPRPHQFLRGRETDTGPHQSQSAASQRRGQGATEASQNPTNLGQQLVFGLDMQPRPTRSRRLSSQQKEINARRRSLGWQTCERHKRSKKFCPCNVPAVELEKLAQASTSYAFGRGSSKHDENTLAGSMHAEELRPLKRRRIGQITTVSGENHESLVTTFLKMRDPNSHDPLDSLVKSTTDTSPPRNYSRPLRVRVSAEEPGVAPGEDYYTYTGRAQDKPQLDLSSKMECMYRNSNSSSRMTCCPGSANPLSIPKTPTITQEQLVNEVKGIYAGLVMVEKKCVEIDSHKSSTTGHLSDEQLQALIAFHRTLLHEHHDFFASQHPLSSSAPRRLANQYVTPARMWRHGMHSFMELLRHRVPDSLDHMLAFVYLAYSMLALEMESAPSIEETWIENLGDLARYRMAVEEADPRDREVWLGVSRMWHHMAADERLDTGSIPPPLAVQARLNSELLESERDQRRGSTSNDDNTNHLGSTLGAMVENIVTHPSAWDEDAADYAQEHGTGYSDLQAHQREHFPGALGLGLVPEGLNDNDAGLESGNKSVRDQRPAPGESQPLPEDSLLRGQMHTSYWHDPEPGGDLSWYSGPPGSSQEAPQSTVNNPDEIAFNEWIGVDGYGDMDSGLVLHNEDALSPVLADTMPSNDVYLQGIDWTVQFFAVVHRPLPIDTTENLLNVIREGVLSEEREESDTKRNGKRHESQNAKACHHNNLVRNETNVDRTEKAANTMTADRVMANFILKTAEPKSEILEPEIDLQSKPFHLPNNTMNHCASLERSNKNCNYTKVGTATKVPVIAERFESSIKATANVAQYPLKVVLMIFTLILASLTPLGRSVEGVLALPIAMHLYGRLLAEKLRHMLQHMPSPQMSLSLLELILGPSSGISSTQREWRQVADLWTVCFYMVVQSFQGCGRLRW
jgi:hypothetical protein